MKRRTKKIIAGILAICIMIACFPLFEMEALAASGRISFNDPSVSVGDAVSVTMKVEAVDDSYIGSVEIMLSYDSSVLEFTGGDNAFGGAGSIRVANAVTSSTQKSMSFQLHFKTIQAGTTAVSVSSQEVYSYNEELMSLGKIGNSSVKVNAPVTYSNDANLTSLAVSPGALTPGFSPDVTSYSMNVGSDVSKVVVAASQSHKAAKISISGNTDLKAGANKAVVKVTAEDKQTVKTYTITINKEKGADTSTEASSESAAEPESQTEEEKNDKIVIEGKEYTPKAPGEAEILPGYSADILEYKNMQVPCLIGNANNLILFYVEDEAQNSRYFIYFPDKDQFLPFQQVFSEAKSLTVFPFEEDIKAVDGYVESVVQIKDQSIMALVPKDESGREFCLIYGMNQKGEKGFYKYDFREETMQRYAAEPQAGEPAVEAVSNDEYLAFLDSHNKLIDDFNVLVIAVWGLGILSLILILFIFYILFFKKRDKEGDDGGSKRSKRKAEVKKTGVSNRQVKSRLEEGVLEDDIRELGEPDNRDGRSGLISDETSGFAPAAKDKELQAFSNLRNHKDFFDTEEPVREKKEEILEMDFDDDFEFLDIEDE